MILLALLLAFVVGALRAVYVTGVCCADDAYFAVVAKNLASGVGYVSTIPAGRPQFTAVAFDPYITTGPTLIVPTALLIKLFGNRYWVPGLSVILCWSILLVFIGLLLRRYNSGGGLAMSALAFFFLSRATPLYYGSWVILLGEIPAALLIVLGVLLFFHSEKRLFRFAAGISFALAILAKVLAIGAIAGFVGVAVAIWMGDRGPNRRPGASPFLWTLAYMTCGIVLPLALFEAWKYLALGPVAYLDRLGESWQILTGVGVQVEEPTTMIGLYGTRLAIFQRAFGIWLPGVLLMFIPVWFLVRRDAEVRRLCYILVSMVVVYALWWIFFSSGLTRYGVMPLLLAFVVMGLPFLRRPLRPGLLALYAALLVIWSIPPWLLTYRDGGLTATTVGRERIEALLEVSRLLEPAVARHEVIVTQWWGTAADMEYIMDTHLNFQLYTNSTAVGSGPYLVAFNSALMQRGDAAFVDLLQSCRRRQQVNVYYLAECGTTATK